MENVTPNATPDTPELNIPTNSPVLIPQNNTDTDDTQPTLQQPSLTLDKTDKACRDAAQYNQLHDYFRILFKNVSTLNPHMLDMMAMATKIYKTNTSFFSPRNQHHLEIPNTSCSTSSMPPSSMPS